MITYISNSEIGNRYRILYEKATRELMAHNASGELVEPENISTGEPLITPTVCTQDDLSGSNYDPGKYFTWNDEKKCYETANDAEPEEGKEYYKAESITSLNKYFSYIRNLAEINPIYTVLPLDEDTFDVDLNSRKINIPTHFAQNGVSVQGDEIAEVLYFKVNRFFDAQDLAQGILREDAPEGEKMQIYIQWRSAEEGEDGKLIEGVSVPWVVDLETYPNYILFGWPISSKITGKAGDIQFAVRFFKFKDQKIVYSLSTLTHTLKIQPSLDFDISEKLLDILNGSANSALVLDDNTNLILDRLVNSEVYDAGVQADRPFFFIVKNVGPDGPLVTPSEDPPHNVIHEETGDIYTSKGLVPEFWLEEGSTPGLLNKPTKFKVQGSSADGGKITYKWTMLKNDPLNENEHRTVGNVSAKNDFDETDDTEKMPGKIYYKKVTRGGVDAYDPLDDPIFKDPSLTEEEQSAEYQLQGPVYEKYSIAQINGTGYYRVTIENRVQNSMSRKESIEMVVAVPLRAVIDDEGMIPERAYLDEKNDWSTTLTVTAVPQDKSYLTYQWYYNKTGAGGLANATAIEGATASSYTVRGSREADAVNGAEGDGFYYVVVTSNMNNYPGITVDGRNNPNEGTRVTHRPSQLEVRIANGYQDSYNLAEAQAINGIKVQVILDPSKGEDRRSDLGDTITYQWFKYQTGTGENTTTDSDKQAAIDGRYVVDGDIAVTEATPDGDTYVPLTSGDYYFCRVGNIYNGDAESAAYSCSPFFFISNNPENP